MRLNELTTPFERRRVIEYGADGNKVVRHWYEMRHVIGPLYMSRITKNEYESDMFTLFVFFPGVPNGFTYWEDTWHPEQYTTEHVLRSLEHDGYASQEQLIATLNLHVEKDIFIGNAWIEFVRQFDSERADVYAKHRADFYARREEQDRQERLARQAEEEAEKARQQAELEKEKAVYLGWADKMTALRFGKVKAQMEKLARFDGKVMSYRDIVIQSVKDGWMPKKQEGVTTWYGSRWEPKQSKPKTVYKLAKGNLCYTISKTEFDFAEFLVSKSTL